MNCLGQYIDIYQIVIYQVQIHLLRPNLLGRGNLKKIEICPKSVVR